MSTSPPSAARRQLLERYTHLRDEHLQYLQKWGLLRTRSTPGGDLSYAFEDVAIIRQADEMVAEGMSFRAVLRRLLASRSGQLTFDFRIEAEPAKILQLKRREPPPMAELLNTVPQAELSLAEERFHAASLLDDGDPAHFDHAAFAYRQALAVDPSLVPALINLANIHYARDEGAEAQALYERAIALEPDVFEAHFNLGNILHDLGRYADAQDCYRQALVLNPGYANAHFYLAVALEKSGQSNDARAHWRAYQQLAPKGEWVDLAQEFSE